MTASPSSSHGPHATVGDWNLPYASRRQPVLADDVIATSQPLAVQAGMAMFERGGNAVDAALAAAIALTVVEPTSNGIGGDAFAIVWDGDAMHGLNASGPAPARLVAKRLLGRDAMPLRGWDAVTVPGAVSAWVALSRRFGALGFEELFVPAIRCARQGFLVAPVTAAAWARAADLLGERDDFALAFLPGGRSPAPGERFRFADQAATLEAIAATGGDAFYRGDLAERIEAHARAEGGALRADDLAGYAAEWVRPLALDHRDVTVHELPPNGQGIAALIALGILARTDHATYAPGSAAALHLEIEAMKLAFADVHTRVADPSAMTVDPAALLDATRLDARAAGIAADEAADPGHRVPRSGGTVYLATADREGRAVSYIQSNYHGFGSGVVVPGTGIALHNRGAGFVTDPDHPNSVAPGKRPYHTIIPGFVSDEEGPLAAFGVMGGPMQPQGHVQVLSRVLAGENPQAAIDAPRWRIAVGRTVLLEDGVSGKVADALARRGHAVERVTPAAGGLGSFGGAQAVWRLPAGWLAASDPRKDGHAAGR